jgi:hypothetical protein
MLKKHAGLKSLAVGDYLPLLTALIECDLSDLWVTSTNRNRDVKRIAARCDTEGIRFLTVALPQLGKALDKALSTDLPFTLPKGWKTQGQGQLPVFLGDLFGSVFGTDGELLPSVDCRSVAGIRQIAYLFYKLNVPYTDEQCKNTVDSFVDVDAQLPHLGAEHYPGDRLLRLARRYCSSALEGFDPMDITPRHGTGSVATGEKGREKSNFSRLYSSIEQLYPFTDYYQYNWSHTVDSLDTIQKLELHPEPCARIVLVPKDSRGPRIISMEPLEVQWIQQGIMRKLYPWLENHRLCRRVLNLTDQTINQDLARESSFDDLTRESQSFEDLCTLDMKEASDRVSLVLVEALLSATSLYPSLLATRSQLTELPNGRQIRMKKFAPMGSALCFPIEALVFWSICSAVLHTDYYKSYSGPLRNWAGVLSVFGDDLVVPLRLHNQIVAALENYSLLVNKDKCCFSSVARFRESCGVDVIRGHDVTPVRIKRVIDDDNHTWIASWVAQGNLCYSRGLQGLAAAIESRVNQHMLNSGLMSIPYTDEVCGIITHVRPYACKMLNKYVKTRFNRATHTYQLRGYRVATKSRPPLYDGWEEMLRKCSEGGDILDFQENRTFDPLDVIGAPKKRVYSIRRSNYLATSWSLSLY